MTFAPRPFVLDCRFEVLRTLLRVFFFFFFGFSVFVKLWVNVPVAIFVGKVDNISISSKTQ